MDGEYPMFDGHGSERTVTSSNQTVTGTANYEAFGQTVGTTGSSTSPYMYAGDWGYRNDGDAGLLHVGARYYDAQVGRFITRDTVLSEHPYLYCEHDAANALDPSGHYSDWNPLDWDYRFNADDWDNICRRIDLIGSGEMGVGGAVICPYPFVGGYPKPVTPITGFWANNVLKPVTVAVGGGLLVGGTIVKGIVQVANLASAV